MTEVLALLEEVLPHGSVGRDDVDGEDDGEEGQLRRQEVEKSGLAAAVARHQSGKERHREKDARPETDDGLLVDAEISRRRR